MGSLVDADAVTNERGAGGSLTINATESVEIIGTGDINGETVNSSLFTLAEGTGDAGDLTLTTDNLSIGDGGNIDGSATGSGSAGELNITANDLTLDRGEITATTAAGTGGNIGLEIAENITLSNNSLISAQASGTADGGNVDIDTEFIIATPNENNDILASAEDGVGGNINISAEALFGIEARNQNDTTNDINASSERNIDGTVSIETPEINNLRPNTELPRSVVPPRTIVAQGCNIDEGIEGQGSFVVSGKGGVPPLPTEPFTIGVVHVEETGYKAPTFEELSQVEDKDLIPARGVIVKPDGGIILTAYPTPGTPGYREYKESLNCHYQ